jgi:hypothetical protein
MKSPIHIHWYKQLKDYRTLGGNIMFIKKDNWVCLLRLELWRWFVDIGIFKKCFTRAEVGL